LADNQTINNYLRNFIKIMNIFKKADSLGNLLLSNRSNKD